MNTAIILSGGVGSRMGLNCPKTYLLVHNRPIISYCLKIFQNHPKIDNIVIVAAKEWQDFILKWLEKEEITKFSSFADAGETRQHSIYNGLLASKEYTDDNGIVIIHDAARPLVSRKIISDCIDTAKKYGGAMPVIPVKDTVYFSETGKKIDSLLDRNTLFSGQAPEAFRFLEYLSIHESVTDQEITNTVGTSQIAFNHGIDVHFIEGSERNFKITTAEDLKTFETYLADL